MNPELTPYDVVTLAFVGAVLAIFALLFLAGVALAVYCAIRNVTGRLEEARARRHDLNTCRAIDRLGTTDTDQP